MFIEFTDKFQTGDYAFANWTCSDGISRDTLYKVIKRTPKQVKLAAIYPSGMANEITYKIQNDANREYALDNTRYYAWVMPAKEKEQN